MEDNTEDELEFENQGKEPAGATSFNMNRTLQAHSASLIANAQRERRRANVIAQGSTLTVLLQFK